MILIICVVLGAIIVGLYIEEGFIPYFLGGLLGLMVGLLISLFLISLPCEKEWTLRDSKEIIAMQDGNTTTGNFYLFGGTIKDEFVYRYAYKDEAGIRIDDCKAKESVIVYTDDTPKMSIYTGKFKNPILNFLVGECDEEYYFYIPEGSITAEYSVDLK